MKILIIGAGAVGQVYGRHLELGGAEVYYFVKEKHAADLRRGLVFYLLNHRHPRETPVRQALASDRVLTRADEVAKIAFDQIYLCMSSAGLRGDWLAALAPKLGSQSTVVSLQPGPEDREYLLKYFPESRLVSGMITVISYAAPLPGEKVPEPGMAYWFPPFSPAPFSGPEDRVRAVLEPLQKGGLPSKAERDVPGKVAFPSTLLMTLLTALEAVGWSFDQLIRGDHLKLVREATREAMEITGRRLGVKGPRGSIHFLRPTLIRLARVLARIIIPMDIETYLRIHFTKVGDQTRLAMGSYLEQGKSVSLPTTALQRL
ncbi:MAG: ketopantoate reductase family protein, partial [Bdellovibrionota bacterium]